MSGARTDAARRSSSRGLVRARQPRRAPRGEGVTAVSAGPDLGDAQVAQARRRVPEDREGARPTARWSTYRHAAGGPYTPPRNGALRHLNDVRDAHAACSATTLGDAAGSSPPNK